jgi:hypothetical protein
MPVEDPKALAQTYLAKHNIEKIFEVSPRTAPPRRCRSDTCVRVCVLVSASASARVCGGIPSEPASPCAHRSARECARVHDRIPDQHEEGARCVHLWRAPRRLSPARSFTAERCCCCNFRTKKVNSTRSLSHRRYAPCSPNAASLGRVELDASQRTSRALNSAAKRSCAARAVARDLRGEGYYGTLFP